MVQQTNRMPNAFSPQGVTFDHASIFDVLGALLRHLQRKGKRQLEDAVRFRSGVGVGYMRS